MGMGIVSDTEFAKELERTTEVKLPEVLPLEKGRKPGDTNVPDSLRKIIGETSLIEGRQAAIDLAKSFGVSESSVSAYANGSTSTSSMMKRPNLNFLNARKEKITRKAARILARSIDNITEDKLEQASVTELATVARGMSAVIKEMEPETESNEGKQTPQFVVFAPQISDERKFEVVVARE